MTENAELVKRINAWLAADMGDAVGDTDEQLLREAADALLLWKRKYDALHIQLSNQEDAARQPSAPLLHDKPMIREHLGLPSTPIGSMNLGGSAAEVAHYAEKSATPAEVEVIDPYVMDLVRKHGSTMTNSEIVQKFLPKEQLSAAPADVYCHPCSVAGGADRAVYHQPPACPAAPAEGDMLHGLRYANAWLVQHRYSGMNASDHFLEIIRSIESAAHADTVPTLPGVVVPREPTPDMAFMGGGVNLSELRAKKKSESELTGEICVGMDNAKAIYRAMLAAAPTLPGECAIETLDAQAAYKAICSHCRAGRFAEFQADPSPAWWHEASECRATPLRLLRLASLHSGGEG